MYLLIFLMSKWYMNAKPERKNEGKRRGKKRERGLRSKREKVCFYVTAAAKIRLNKRINRETSFWSKHWNSSMLYFSCNYLFTPYPLVILLSAFIAVFMYEVKVMYCCKFRRLHMFLIGSNLWQSFNYLSCEEPPQHRPAGNLCFSQQIICHSEWLMIENWSEILRISFLQKLIVSLIKGNNKLSSSILP